jgi:hypothetical protein
MVLAVGTLATTRLLPVCSLRPQGQIGATLRRAGDGAAGEVATFHVACPAGDEAVRVTRRDS